MIDTRHFLKDFGVIALSILIAAALVSSGLIESLLTSTHGLRLFGAFFAGVFFTSIFTTAPAIVALGIIAQNGSVLETAAIGALGAVIGDMLIFVLIRDRLSEHIMEHLKENEGWARFMILIRTRSFRLASLFIGGLIIASPFPDEIGISLMGISKLRTSRFVPLSYIFNFIGIMTIGSAARVLA